MKCAVLQVASCVFKDWREMNKVDTATTDSRSMDAHTLNYWMSEEVANSKSERKSENFVELSIWTLKAVGSEVPNRLELWMVVIRGMHHCIFRIL